LPTRAQECGSSPFGGSRSATARRYASASKRLRIPTRTLRSDASPVNGTKRSRPDEPTDGPVGVAPRRRFDLASLVSVQADINGATAGNWSIYASHRAHVTELTLAALSRHRSGRLCVLGAGNCNDLALARIAGHAAEIHLVDIDGAALERGVARAREAPMGAGSAHLVRHVGVELTGLAPFLETEPRTPGAAVLEQALAGPTLAIGQPFDVVVSAGLLTQLISLPVEALEAGHPGLTPIVLAIRTGHLRLLARLLRPGGHALLITDVVSSDTTRS
jgi:hypothetical protein